MNVSEIPLLNQAQNFTVKLAGTTYRLRLNWSMPANIWILDIAKEDETPIVSGIALVCNIDLLRPYPYLNFGGALVAQVIGSADANPGYEDLGSTSKLFFITV
jgi:hypothetical protein